MKNYQRINNLTGFLLFGFATCVYWLTMQPTLSFWDCGEFIAAADKLQVGHQPGAPFFLMIGKVFGLLAMGDTSKIAYWTNFSSVIFSAATIMFLYWTITALAAKLYPIEKNFQEAAGVIAAGLIGALTYTFSDTFWFSAVEAEVYALSSLFTAIAFWAVLKWESEMNDRWLIFIAFMIGLSIGAHLLSLLTIPAIVLVYYFKKTVKPGAGGILKALAIGCLIVGVVQIVIVQYLVLFAAKSDLFFVNTLGLDFGTGALAFIVLVTAIIGFGLYYSLRKQLHQLNLGLLCLTFILFGFSSYFVIIIRANAKPNINLSNPDNAFSLYEYLGRTNYEATPLLYGRTFDAQQTGARVTGTEYRKGKKQYEVAGNSFKAEYDKNMLFPRVHSTKAPHADFYRQWLGLGENESPGFLKNLGFFSSYQVGFMYLRYFLWNFAGRQNDEQGHGSLHEGNWITGIKPLDALRLGNQNHLPPSIAHNEGRNVFYGLPLLLGIAGLYFLYRKKKSLVLTIGTLFFFTGLAIILYLNQDPLQVRERDYAYVGSFYAFAIFIGFGVLALREFLTRYFASKLSLVLATAVCLVAVPGLMGIQGWDDHDRSDKKTALQLATNYLNSCAPNAILFTNADNDTYPLWYAQEVEGIRTDVRVICIQFLADSDFITQMKKQSNKSAPLPIHIPAEKYKKGLRDYMPYIDYGIPDSVELNDLLAVLTSDAQEDQVQMQDGSYQNFLPAKRLKMTINAAQVIKTNTLAAKYKDRIAKVMEWDFNKNFAGKADLTMFDIIVNNNWERPIYFGSSLSSDTYLGLDKYLYLEGYAYRLLPLERAETDTRQKEESSNSEVMYHNVMHKLDYSAFNKTPYLDPESRRVAFDTWRYNNTLASNLIAESKQQEARNVIMKSMDQLPLRNYSIRDTLNKLNAADVLFSINESEKAAVLAKTTADFLDKELNYIATLEPRLQRNRIADIELGMGILNSLAQLTGANKQNSLNHEITARYKYLESIFLSNLG